MTTIRHCSIPEFGRAHTIKQLPRGHHQTSARHWSLTFSDLISNIWPQKCNLNPHTTLIRPWRAELYLRILVTSYQFYSLRCRFYVSYLLFCGTDDAPLSEINILVLIHCCRTAARKSSIGLYVRARGFYVRARELYVCARGLCVRAGGLDIQILQKFHYLIVFHISIWGAWSFV